MRKRIISIFLLSAILLYGCGSGKRTVKRYKIVTQMTVTAGELTRTYTDQDKMETILFFLRVLRSKDLAPAGEGAEFSIRFTHPDGSESSLVRKEQELYSVLEGLLKIMDSDPLPEVTSGFRRGQYSSGQLTVDS